MITRATLLLSAAIALGMTTTAAAQQTERQRRAADPSTATLDGLLVAGAARTPLAGTTVILRTVEGRRIGDATSGVDGRFTFTKLRSGGYRVVVPVHGHEVNLGGVFITVGRVKTESFRKGAIITGRLETNRASALSGVPVCALREGRNKGSQFDVAADAVTDLDGDFVIHDQLAAGDGRYLIAASPDGCQLGVARPAERLAGMARTFFPSTTDAAAAEAIEASPIRDRVDVTIRMSAVPGTRIDGRLLGYVNDTVVPGFVILEPAPGRVSLIRTAKTTPDGRFAFFAVPPGKHTLIVPPRSDKTSTQSYAMGTIDVDGRPSIPVALGMKPASWIAGQITFDGRTQAYFGVRTFSAITANPHYPRAEVNRLLPSPYSLFNQEGRFMIQGLLPGDYTITTQGIQALGWVPVAATATRAPGGLPLPDAFAVPLTIAPGEGIFDMQVKFTARASTIKGSLTFADGRPAGSRRVAVFAADESALVLGQPSLTLNVDPSGDFESPILVEGDYLVAIRPMVAVAAADLPALLAGLRANATRVTVRAGEKTAVTLTVR